MSYLKAGTDATGQPINLFYQDWGQGPTTFVLIHGWPLDHQSWEYQLNELPKHGARVVAYDRRGFGKSSKPWDGYDYDTLAADLKAVLDGLDLQDVVLVGFSMGGGEVARYMSRYQGARVSKVALVSAVTPFLLKTNDNPDGVPGEQFDGMVEGLLADRPGFLATFGKHFFGVGLISRPVSQATLDWTLGLALLGSPRATEACARAFSETDFRPDLATLQHVPTLLIHGSNDQTVPPEVSTARVAKALPHARYLVYADAPHGLFITEKDRLSRDLFEFATAG